MDTVTDTSVSIIRSLLGTRTAAVGVARDFADDAALPEAAMPLDDAPPAGHRDRRAETHRRSFR